MLWPLLLCGAASFMAILRLLHTYGDRKRCAWYVQLASVTSWYLPFTIVFILPFDFSSTLYRRCELNCDEPLGYISSEFTRRLWFVLYWFMYTLTWLVLPIMMSYVDSGAFSFKARLRESAWSNLQFYGISGVVGLVLVGYVVLTRRIVGTDLVAFMMALANFWGLFLVITFMGFGLVSIPRKLWRQGDLVLELSKIQSRAVAYKDKAYDSALELSDIVREANLVSSRIGYNDDLRHCVDTIMEYCPRTDANGIRPSTQNATLSDRIPVDITETYLAALHNRIKKAVLKEERDRWRWNRSARRAFFLQDAIDSSGNPRRQLESNLRPWSQWSIGKRAAAWWWYIALRPVVYRALSIAAAVLSVGILWSEITFNLDSSHFSLVNHLLRSMGLSYFAIEATSIVIIAYMSLCAYSSVMKLRLFNIYSLESHHHTNERSLLFCGAYLCRLMFPLCYNFLNMAGGVDASKDDEATEFSKFMDKIDLVPVLGEQSNRAIPVLIMVPAALAFFNIHGRVMEYFSISRAGVGTRASGVSAGANGDDDGDEEAELGPLCLPQEEGRGLLLEARRAAEHMQGVTDSDHARRYSPSGSTHSSSTNYRTYLSSVGSAGDPAIVSGGSGVGRGPREWHLGRPSLDRLHDDTMPAPMAAPFDSPSDTANLGVFSDSAGIHSAGGGFHGTNTGYQDPLGATGTSGDDGESFSDTSGSTNTDGNTRYGYTSGAQSPLGGGGLGTVGSKPTGMAARFGRWLPTRSSTQSTKPPTSRPNNATRLRPSSRQSNRYNYASDDGVHPGYSTVPRTPTSAQPHMGALGRTAAERYLYTSTVGRGSGSRHHQPHHLQQPLLQSPSSPGRSPNPWADLVESGRSQTRRHALSDSSVRTPRDQTKN
ncbi:hypothetical protein GGI15_001157 [Coemansia interrupta]|uniref:Uncharacterized protein n=1 Tax=Coemansia interrupta TaxID=1126814 RepID=A0A9W8HIY9_9FUNG|nr:hypothetical protein GGI15_001157 [Coemansia interrupta]